MRATAKIIAKRRWDVMDILPVFLSIFWFYAARTRLEPHNADSRSVTYASADRYFFAPRSRACRRNNDSSSRARAPNDRDRTAASRALVLGAAGDVEQR